jgi:hypothetical protein
MFLGHFAAGFAAKRAAPRPSLGTLFMAAQFVDLLWPLMLILGIERVAIDPGHTVVTPLDFTYYPYTHSLVGALAWGVLFGGAYRLLRKDTRSAVVLGLLVVSHWVLDLIVHIPDLPLVPGTDTKVGLGAWNSEALTLIIEILPFMAAATWYAAGTLPTRKRGSWALWSLVAFLLLVYLANVFGPAPDSVDSIGYVGLTQWLLVAWAYWADRNRHLREAADRDAAVQQ